MDETKATEIQMNTHKYSANVKSKKPQWREDRLILFAIPSPNYSEISYKLLPDPRSECELWYDIFSAHISTLNEQQIGKTEWSWTIRSFTAFTFCYSFEINNFICMFLVVSISARFYQRLFWILYVSVRGFDL